VGLDVLSGVGLVLGVGQVRKFSPSAWVCSLRVRSRSTRIDSAIDSRTIRCSRSIWFCSALSTALHMSKDMQNPTKIIIITKTRISDSSSVNSVSVLFVVLVLLNTVGAGEGWGREEDMLGL